MKILIVTQILDKQDDVLGFFHTWVAETAKECEEVTVIALRVGEYTLPANVRVYSLGKESGVSRLKYISRFLTYIIRERNKYDRVLVHMNQVYILLGAPIWKLFGKKIALWYAHGHVPFSLRIATVLVDKVFTSTKSGFRIETPKLRIIGQGIDVERFALESHTQKSGEPFRAIVVGRISPVKDYETTLRALALVKKAGYNITLDIVGGAGLPEQEVYLEKLKLLANELGISHEVVFHGALPNTAIAPLLSLAHCFVNTSRTGSFDKAVGEAMASGLPILSSNEAFREVLGSISERLMFPVGDEVALSKQLLSIIDLSPEGRAELGEALSTIVREKHSLTNFIKKLLAGYDT